MPKAGALLIIASFLFAACAPVISPAAIAPTITEAATSTHQPKPTRTPFPSLTPTLSPLPTATITPPTLETIQPHPLALDLSNVATKMKKLREVGKGYANDLAWSPDGKTLAVASSSGIYFYDTQTWQEQASFINEKGPSKLTYSQDGTLLGFSTSEGNIHIWDIKQGKIINSITPDKGIVTKFKFTQNGYITAEIRGKAEQQLGGEGVRYRGVWNAISGETVFHQEDPYWNNSYFETDISPDGKNVLFWEGKVIENISSGKNTRIHSTHEFEGVNGSLPVTFNADGKKILVGNISELVILDSSGTETAVTQIHNYDKIQSSVRYATCYGSTSFALVDILTGTIIYQTDFPDFVISASFSPDEKRLALSIMGTIAIFDIESKQFQAPLNFNSQTRMATGMVSVNGVLKPLVATGGVSENIQIWDADTGDLIQTLYSNSAIKDFDFSPDNHSLAAIDDKGILTLWNIQNGKQSYTFDLHNISNGPIKFNPNGTKLATISWDQYKVLELDIQTGSIKQLDKIELGYSYAYTLPYNPFLYTKDGHLMTWGYKPSSLSFLDLTTNESVEIPYQVRGDFDFVEAVALSSDKNWLAIGTAGADIHIFDLQNKKLDRTLVGHEQQVADGWMGAIQGLEFSPTSNLLFSDGYDDTIRLWNIETGNPLRIINGGGTAEFTPDGRYLILTNKAFGIYGNNILSIWGIPEN